MDNQDKYLRALVLMKEGKWHESHDIVDAMDTPMAARIHGLLHRIEGDQWNADYWYRRAGVSRPAVSTDQERDVLINQLSLKD